MTVAIFSDSMKDCEENNQTTAHEVEDEFPESLCKKRPRKPRVEEHFLKHFSECNYVNL